MKRIAIFASGSGTNAENIINFFADSDDVQVALVAANNPEAYVVKRAENAGVPSYLFNKDQLLCGKVAQKMTEEKIDCIVLAGFLWLIPDNLIEAFADRIINIHPALLPLFGGKGMYGDRVHKAVVEAKMAESGITIHLVNEHYDSGNTIAQFKVALSPSDTPDDVAAKVHQLEYKHYPQVIERFLSRL